MRSNSILFPFAIIGIFFSGYTFAGNEKDATENDISLSLCDTNDLVFFTCATTNNKLVSLCGKGARNAPSGVYYRFGRKDEIEMDFPEDKGESSFSKFNYNYYVRHRVLLRNISFSSDGYYYSLYDHYRGDDSDEKEIDITGVFVGTVDSNQALADIRCRSSIYINLSGIDEKLEPEQEQE